MARYFLWSCPKCGMTSTLDSIRYPLHCICGHVDQGPAQPAPAAPPPPPIAPAPPRQSAAAPQPATASVAAPATVVESVSGVYVQSFSPGGGPTMFQRAANFTKAAVQHVAAGMPRCDQAEIDRRYDICMACEHHADAQCRLCGCWIRREAGSVSKLAWADQHCPISKW